MSSALQSSKLSVFGKPLMDGETRHAVASSVSDENIGHQLVTVSAVMIALQVLAVGARLSARRVQKTVFFVDDYLIVVALLGGLAICGIAIMGVNVAKFGRHQDWIMTNEPDSLTPFGKLSVAAQSLQTPIAITFAKLSILFFYRRIFPLPSIHCAILAIGAWIVAHGFATLLVSLLQCIPLSAVWDAGVKGKCIDPVSWLRWMSLPNIMSDLALIILPLYVIWRLQKSRTERLGLSVIFLSGSLWVAHALSHNGMLTFSTPVISSAARSAWPCCSVPLSRKTSLVSHIPDPRALGV